MTVNTGITVEDKFSKTRRGDIQLPEMVITGLNVINKITGFELIQQNMQPTAFFRTTSGVLTPVSPTEQFSHISMHCLEYPGKIRLANQEPRSPQPCLSLFAKNGNQIFNLFTRDASSPDYSLVINSALDLNTDLTYEYYMTIMPSPVMVVAAYWNAIKKETKFVNVIDASKTLLQPYKIIDYNMNLDPFSVCLSIEDSTSVKRLACMG